ncbi:aldose 1-epimerase [Burkholderia stagnalis]
MSEDCIDLVSGVTRARIAPHVGGSIAAYYEETPDGLLHWLRPATDTALARHDPLGMASFPLFPYCNRIRDARFAFEGRMIDLSDPAGASRHALHGHGWRRPWKVAARGDTWVELRFEHRPDPDGRGDWPFHYVAHQTIRLEGNALSIALGARNLDTVPMPFGMGHHPYYVRTAQTIVSASVEAMWHTDAEVLPTYVGPHPAVDALRDGMRADAFDLDNNFVGWSREAVVKWPDRGRQLTLTADPAFGQLVVFAPADDNALCVEPVTNTTDCFNAKARDPRAPVGGWVLAPGEAIDAALRWMPARL